jgi:hypothetical protein
MMFSRAALTTLMGHSISRHFLSHHNLESAGINDLAGGHLVSTEPAPMSMPLRIGIVALSILVVLVAMAVELGIMWCVWSKCCEGEIRGYTAVAGQTQKGAVKDNAFTGDLRPTTLLSCFRLEFSSMCEGLCCPLFVFMENQEKAKPTRKRTDVKFVSAFVFAMKCLCSCGIYWLYVRTKYRLTLSRLPPGAESEAGSLKGKCLACCAVTCCGCCAVMQEAQFLEMYDAYSNGKGFEEALGAPEQEGMV